MSDYLNSLKLDVLNKLITSDLIAECEQCRTDEERFVLALKIVVKNSALLFTSDCKQKDSLHSVKSREDGNQSFNSGQHYQALQEYTESIVYAVDASRELALAYANRSATLFKLRKYADCVADIDRSLNLNYPDELKTKLYKRKGLCLITLRRPGADSSFREALVWLDKMKLDKPEMNRSRNELTKLMSAPGTGAKLPTNVAHNYRLPEIVTSNPEVPCASDAVTIKYSKKFGRHLVATRQIKSGEILVLEKPYCSRLTLKHVYTHCSHCLLVSWNMIPCKYCVNVAYCSESCKEKAWEEYHEIECPVVGQLLDYKFNNVLWMSVRMVIKATQKGSNFDALKQELRDVNLNTDPRTKGFNDDEKYCSDTFRSVYSLANNVDKCSTKDLLARAFWVALTVCIIARESTMFGEKLELVETLVKNPDVIFVGGLISKNVHTVFINIHSYGGSRYQYSSDLGHALLPFCSLLNHSCDANTIRQWYRDRIALYAAYPIEQGEQIFDNYGPRFVAMAKSERQAWFNRWHFQCGCLPCTGNWPMLQDIPSYRKQLMSQQIRNKMDRAMRKFLIHNASIQKGIIANSPNVLNELLELIELLFQHAHRPCGELIMAVSMLKDYYEAADVMFNYEPVDLSKIEKERIVYYLGYHLNLARN